MSQHTRTKKRKKASKAPAEKHARTAGSSDELFDTDQWLKTILEGSPIPKFVIDGNHNVIHWNKALEQMSNIQAAGVIGTNKHWQAFYDRERPCMADLLVDGRIDEISRWYRGKYRKSKLIPDAYEATDFFPALGTGGKWLLFTAAILRNSEEKIVGAIETLEDITDKRLAEKALKESEQSLKSVLEGSTIPTFVINIEHKVIYWNKALEELSGIKANDVIDTNQHWRAFYDEERPCMADLIVDDIFDEIPKWYLGKYKKSKLIDEAYEATDFFPAIGSNGRWLRFTAAALRNTAGILFGAIETLEDITERKQSDDALRESEYRLKSILEGSPIPTFIIGKDHRVIHWNKALEELSGIKAEDAIDTRKHWEAFYNKERPCMADLLVDELLDEIPPWYAGKYRKSELIEDAFEATDFFPALGSEGKWLRFTATALRDSKGSVFAAIETLEDITEQKRTDEARRESEQRLTAVMKGSPIPAFIIGKDHRLLYWNESIEKLTGIPAEEAIGTRKHWDIFYDNEKPCMADLLIDELLDEIPPWYSDKYAKSELIENAYESTEFFPEIGSGGKWLRFTAVALRDSEGILFGAIETIEDITALKLVEIALKEKEQRYMELSITDGLTGLGNLRNFYMRAKSEIDRSNRYKHPLSILMIDIDDFKEYNDTYGHLEGDKVLMRLGQVIRRCLRQTDSAYRYGGEEFTVILPETKGEAASSLAERVRREFEQETFSPRSDVTIRKTISLGVTQYIPAEELSTLLKRADESMYIAKKEGKNRICFSQEKEHHFHPAYHQDDTG